MLFCVILCYSVPILFERLDLVSTNNIVLANSNRKQAILTFYFIQPTKESYFTTRSNPQIHPTILRFKRTLGPVLINKKEKRLFRQTCLVVPPCLLLTIPDKVAPATVRTSGCKAHVHKQWRSVDAVALKLKLKLICKQGRL